MKAFTFADVYHARTQYPRLFVVDRADLISAPLQWQAQGLQQTATGYGAKLTTIYLIQYEGRRYRIYATCYGNASSSWFTAKGTRIYID
jgi:hypothetical protein